MSHLTAHFTQETWSRGSTCRSAWDGLMWASRLGWSAETRYKRQTMVTVASPCLQVAAERRWRSSLLSLFGWPCSTRDTAVRDFFFFIITTVNRCMYNTIQNFEITCHRGLTGGWEDDSFEWSSTLSDCRKSALHLDVIIYEGFVHGEQSTVQWFDQTDSWKGRKRQRCLWATVN